MGATTLAGEVVGLETVDANVRVTISPDSVFDQTQPYYGRTGAGFVYVDDVAPALGARKTITIDGGGSPSFSATVTGVDLVDTDVVRVATSLVLHGTVTFFYFCKLADAPALGASVGVVVA